MATQTEGEHVKNGYVQNNAHLRQEELFSGADLSLPMVGTLGLPFQAAARRSENGSYLPAWAH